MARRNFGLKYTRNATREERNAYARAQRKAILANPEWAAVLRRKEAELRSRKRDELLERQRKWRVENPERWREIQRNWSEKNRERLNAEQREENKTPARKAYLKQYLRQHRQNNKDLYRTYTENRRASRVGAVGSHTKEEWLAKIAEYEGCCAYCGSLNRLVRDHDVPLSRGGSNYISNIVPACNRCNSSKHDSTGEEFRARLLVDSKCSPAA
jgi:5-methylcytosine-specific restriction endonuclease McrA